MLTTEELDVLASRVDEALNDVRPHLRVDGGDVEVVEITPEMIAKIRWQGNCMNCSMSAMTLKAGLEQAVKAKVPEIQGIEAVNGL